MYVFHRCVAISPYSHKKNECVCMWYTLDFGQATVMENKSVHYVFIVYHDICEARQYHMLWLKRQNKPVVSFEVNYISK
jgi:hypothetical protein